MNRNDLQEILADKRRLGKYKVKQEDFIDSFLLDIDAKVHPDVTGEYQRKKCSIAITLKPAKIYGNYLIT